jgi:hypothetical protein
MQYSSDLWCNCKQYHQALTSPLVSLWDLWGAATCLTQSIMSPNSYSNHCLNFHVAKVTIFWFEKKIYSAYYFLLSFSQTKLQRNEIFIMKIYTDSNWAYGYHNKHSDRRKDRKRLRVELEPNSSPIMSPKRNPTWPIVDTIQHHHNKGKH